jgi:hypothetical protein
VPALIRVRVELIFNLFSKIDKQFDSDPNCFL